MPLYEYRCDACGTRFERIQKYSDPPIGECPKCGGTAVTKLLSSPAIQFKGSGWYVTDYAAKSGKRDKTGEGGSSSAEGSSEREGKAAGDKGEKSGKSDKGETSDKGEKSGASDKSGKDASKSERTKPPPGSTKD